ncbi:MAG: OmpA family protein [Ignavibacteriae bacterium]|nr:OmpA family protein [Ignavibacteriota bacterium]
MKYLFHKSNIPCKWNTVDCGGFGNGYSFGYGAGFQYSYSLWEDIIWLDLRLNYNYVPVYLSTTTSKYEVYNPQTSGYEKLYLNSAFSSTMHFLNFEPGILIHPFSSVPLKLRLSFDAGYPLSDADYETTEEINSPKFFKYPDNTKKHTTQKGKLSMMGLNYGGIVGLLYDFEFTDNLYFQAGMNFEYPGGSSIYDANLETSSIGFSLSIQYAFGTEKEIKPPKIDSPKVVEPIKPVVVKKEPHIEIQPSQLEVMETIVTQTYPVLPYIFFDSSSSELKSRYIPSRSGTFDEKKLPNETLKIYYSLLDIIGSRMKQNPQSEITITGMSDGRELETSEKRIDIANKRAHSVANYFINNWQIEPKRLKLKTREIPELATSTLYEEGYEENRRVEINSQEFEILKPVIYSRFSEYELISQNLNTSVNIVNADSNADPKIMFFAGNDEIASAVVGIKDTSATINFDDVQKKNIVRALNNKKEFSVKYEYDFEGKKYEAVKNPYIKKNENKFEIGRLNLIVFDFDKSEVNQLNSEMIKNFVANSIEDNSKVDIIGSTDKLGEKDYNLQLSKSRAENTFNFIKEIKPKAGFDKIKGIGDSNLLYDNLLPEGRFYCRTVLIEVTTPVK